MFINDIMSYVVSTLYPIVYSCQFLPCRLHWFTVTVQGAMVRVARPQRQEDGVEPGGGEAAPPR